METSIHNGYSTILQTKLYEIIGQDEYGNDIKDYVPYDFEFDYIESNGITANSTLSSHPTVDGDNFADHIYREPITVSLTGTFSINGNKKTQFGSNRLEDIENIFERIKNEGATCKIVKQNTSGVNRFKVRDNLILTGISWTEMQNSLDFNFSFTEALVSDAKEIQYNVDVTDPDLPSMTAPQSQSFSETNLFDEGEIIKAIISYLEENNLFKAKHWKNRSEYETEPGFSELFADFIGPYLNKYNEDNANYTDWLTKGLGLFAASNVVVLVVAIKVLATIIAGTAEFVPVGTVVAIVAAVALAVTAAVFFIKSKIAQSKYKIQKFKFKYFKDKDKQEEKNKNEVVRFLDLAGSIVDSMKAYNEYIQVFKLTVNEQQWFRISNGNELYKFEFVKVNGDKDSNWGIKVYKNADENPLASYNDISQVCKTSMVDCSNSKDLIGGHNIYLINETLYENDSNKNNLSSYSIMVSQLDLTKWSQMIDDCIKLYCEARD